MYSARMEENISCSIHPSRATDHSPIVAEIGILKKNINESIKYKIVRSMKNFRQDDFNKCLALQPWEKLGMTEDVDVMADMFLDMTKKAFDLCAPEKRSKYISIM